MLCYTYQGSVYAVTGNEITMAGQAGRLTSYVALQIPNAQLRLRVIDLAHALIGRPCGHAAPISVAARLIYSEMTARLERARRASARSGLDGCGYDDMSR